jgi:hypothetical protein
MAFLNVVGGNEIYNFRIQIFEHFYSKFWSKLRSNRGSAKPDWPAVPRTARGPTDRGRRVPRHLRPNVPRI